MFKIFMLQACISVHFSQMGDYQYLRQPECAKNLQNKNTIVAKYFS